MLSLSEFEGVQLDPRKVRPLVETRMLSGACHRDERLHFYACSGKQVVAQEREATATRCYN